MVLNGGGHGIIIQAILVSMTNRELVNLGSTSLALKAQVVIEFRRRSRCCLTHRQHPELWEFDTITCYVDPWNGWMGLRTNNPGFHIGFLASCFRCTVCDDHHIKSWGNLHRNPSWPPLAPQDHRVNDEQLIRRSVMRQFFEPDPNNAAHATALQPVMDELAGLLQAARLQQP